SSQIAVLCSEDTHYSIVKGAGIFGLPFISVPVDQRSRQVTAAAVRAAIEKSREEGVLYFIVVANMATTMFGSVDDPAVYTDILKTENIPFKLHVDAAFGGFIYPLATGAAAQDFRNPDVSSIALDAHKMLQAPYGT